jgi:hypothetical protein
MLKEPANTANDILAIGRKGLQIEQLNRTAAVKICGLSLFQTGKLTCPHLRVERQTAASHQRLAPGL